MTKCFLSSVSNFHLLFTVATRSQDLSDCLFVLSRISCLIFQNINNVTMTSMTSTLTILQYIFTICQQENNKILVKVGLACQYCPPSPGQDSLPRMTLTFLRPCHSLCKDIWSVPPRLQHLTSKY